MFTKWPLPLWPSPNHSSQQPWGYFLESINIAVWTKIPNNLGALPTDLKPIHALPQRSLYPRPKQITMDLPSMRHLLQTIFLTTSNIILCLYSVFHICFSSHYDSVIRFSLPLSGHCVNVYMLQNFISSLKKIYHVLKVS